MIKKPAPRIKRKPPPVQWTITLTEDQALAVQAACEAYARIGMGQIGIACEHFTIPKTNHGALQDILRNAEREIAVLNGLPRNAFFGINSRDVDDNFRRAWDIHTLIRYTLSWERAYRSGEVKRGAPRDFTKHMTVNYDNPTHLADGRATMELSSDIDEKAHHG